jgi:hypothetical protein
MFGRRLGLEALEARHMLSAAASMQQWLATALADRDGGVPAQVAASQPTSSIAASSASAVPSSNWDWMSGTTWYVPEGNLLAYEALDLLANPIAIADQTIWTITSLSDGVLTGTSQSDFSDGLSLTSTMSGVITAGGQVRITFDNSNGSTTVGLGQMRYEDGQWRVEMQMANDGTLIIMHWAYMTLLPEGEAAPAPTDPPTGSSAANAWEWVEGTDWLISDVAATGDTRRPGVFRIEHFDGGYFWGSGTSDAAFNVLGSITPQGNVMLLISQPEAAPAQWTGVIEQTTDDGGAMRLRSYVDERQVAYASSLHASSRLLMASVQGVIQRAS